MALACSLELLPFDTATIVVAEQLSCLPSMTLTFSTTRFFLWFPYHVSSGFILLLDAIALFSAFNFNILYINGEASHLLKFPSILYFVDEIILLVIKLALKWMISVLSASYFVGVWDEDI